MNEEPNKINNEDDDEIILGEFKGLHRKYDYIPYSHYRIKELLREMCNAEAVCVRGYKEGRYTPNYKQRYYIYELGTHRLIRKDIRMDDLRRFFAQYDCPLHRSNRNQGAAYFMQVVRNIIAENATK